MQESDNFHSLPSTKSLLPLVLLLLTTSLQKHHKNSDTDHREEDWKLSQVSGLTLSHSKKKIKFGVNFGVNAGVKSGSLTSLDQINTEVNT